MSGPQSELVHDLERRCRIDGEPGANLGSMSALVRFYDGAARVPMTDARGDGPIDATAKIANLAPLDQRDDKCLIEFKLSAPETLDVRTHGSVTACGPRSGRRRSRSGNFSAIAAWARSSSWPTPSAAVSGSWR